MIDKLIKWVEEHREVHDFGQSVVDYNELKKFLESLK